MNFFNLVNTEVAYKLPDTPIEVGNYFNYTGNVSETGSSVDVLSWFAGFITGINIWFLWTALIICVVANWIIFQKAKQPGWAVLIPIYNTIVYLEIVGRPWWWIFLLLIPVVNLVVSIIITHDLSKVFNRDGWFTLGLLFFPWIFLPILAFGRYVYVSPYKLAK